MSIAHLLKIALTCAALGTLAMASPALAAFGVEFVPADQGAVVEIGFLEEFHATITNTGDQFDTFTITIEKDIPEDWVGSICVGETCFPPFITTVEVEMPAGHSEEMSIDVTAQSIGSGSCNVTVSSQGDPSLRPAHVFTALTQGLDVLVVSDDTPGLADYLTDVMDTTEKTYGLWEQVRMGGLSQDELTAFDTVVWSAGEQEGSLDADLQAALAYFVQHGGNLFLTGRDLAYESCDPGSPYYSAASASWFNMVLGTDYTGDVDSSFDMVDGVAGDPITGGVSFGLSGGDGANNTHLTLDGVAPAGGGLASLQYTNGTPGEYAAIRSVYGDGKTYFCAFAFEAINNAADRAGLLTTTFDWFDGLLVPANDLVRPLLVQAPYASPNPFNPQTSIKFEVGGERSLPVQVVVYDLRGQVVRRLFSGSVQPGPQAFAWNGRDDAGRNAATGVYLAQVKIDGQTSEPVKMTLVK